MHPPRSLGRHASAFLLAALGCTAAEAPRSAERSTGDEDTEARACPRASAMHQSFWTEDEGSGAWSVPVGAIRVGDEDYDAVPDEPIRPEGLRVGEVTRELVATLGLSVLPEVVWLMREDQPPCAAHPLRYEGSVVADGVTNIRLDALLEGCAAPADTHAAAWVSTEAPGACRLVNPSRLGEMGLDASGSIPDVVSPLPPLYAGPSEPPDFDGDYQSLWRITLARGAPNVAEVWVSRTDGVGEPCGWACDSWSMLEVEGPDGVMVPTDWPRFDGVESAMSLVGLLVDSQTRVVLLAHRSASAAAELGPDGSLSEGRRLEHYIPHEEDGIHRSLCPYCGP